MPSSRFSFDTPYWLIAAAIVAAIAIAIGWRRRVALPKASLVLGASAMVLLAVAAGSPRWHRPVAGEVAVLVDVSPSTRTAAFRDRALLDARLRQLLGDVPHRVYRFADGVAIADDGSPLSDLPAAMTRLPGANGFSGARAWVLYSDGRWDLPAAAPPVYAVVDPALSRASDARVTSLRIDGGDAVAGVAVEGVPSATLRWSIDGVADARGVDLKPGSIVLRKAIGPQAGGDARAPSTVAAAVAAADAWPENDRLSIVPPPPAVRQRWFVTKSAAAPAGYVRRSPADLPTTAEAYLSVSAIVLDNLPATAIPAAVQDRLLQFVRDLGGGLVIVGGDRAFAAGGYVGTAIDALSPLASSPPRPSTHWMLLTDGSGSMNADAGGARTRWQSATAALLRLLPSIPAEDPVTLGHFAADITWWSTARPAGETRSLSLPPTGAAPGGPTNLRPAIEAAAARHDPALPGQLLILSDAETDLGDAASLAATLRTRNVRLHVLAVGDGKALPALRQVAEQTGGSVVQQADAARWADAAADLLQSAGDRRFVVDATTVRFLDALSRLPARQVSGWNRTWLKPRAQPLAEASASSAGAESVPMSARWQLGQGTIGAIAFAQSDVEREALVNLVAAVPRDPRFALTIEPGGLLRVIVDATDSAATPASRYLNGLELTLTLTALEGESRPQTAIFSQTAPGRYEVKVESPARPMLATVTNGAQVIDRFAVAARYPREFDAVGIDRDNLKRLVDRFGGAVIEADQVKPIDFQWPREAVDIAAWVAGVGVALLLAALLWWRWA